MELIDDDGNLLGIVNVIDALVILLMIAVLIAGAALLGFVGTQPVEETRYVTIELGEHPEYVASQITEGDTMAPDRTDGNLTVTDVYVTPTENETVAITLRAEIEGALVESHQREGKVFEYNNKIIRPGASITVDTLEYELDGTVVSVAPEGPSLETDSTSVILEMTVSRSAAQQIAVGQTKEIGEKVVTEVTDIHLAPGDGEHSHTLTVGLELETLTRDGNEQFGARPLYPDRTLQLTIGESRYEGTIVAVGDGELSRPLQTVTIQTTTSTVTAQQLEVGDTYEIAGETVATINDVTTYPTTDPTTRRVVLEVQLQTIRSGGPPQFGAEPVKLGAVIPFETEDYSITGTVIARDSLSRSSETKTITTTVKLERVQPELADAIQIGMTEEVNGAITARVVNKHAEPAATILTSQDGDIFQRDHPRDKDVYLTVEMKVRETTDGLYFHGVRIQHGNNVVLDFRTITVQGMVIDIDE